MTMNTGYDYVWMDLPGGEILGVLGELPKRWGRMDRLSRLAVVEVGRVLRESGLLSDGQGHIKVSGQGGLLGITRRGSLATDLAFADTLNQGVDMASPTLFSYTLPNIALAVNGAAALANSVKSPAQLAQLFALLTELTNAVSPQISQDPSHYDSTRPWRTLLINRAIVATRSHQPALMEEAFDALREHIPGEVPDFLREGMEQMDALNYPPHVKRVMERYYDLWCGHRILH